MTAVAIYLPKHIERETIEDALGVMFAKNIEQARLARLNDGYLFFTRFNTLCFVNFTKEQIGWALERLEFKDAYNYEHTMLYQDYPLKIDPALEGHFKVTNDEIILKELSVGYISIIALVVSQSVGLEKYEQMVDIEFPKSKELLSRFSNSTFFLRRKELLKYATSLALMRHNIVSDMYLLDKPNILWDDEVGDKLYNILSGKLELRDRFDILEYKLNMLKDDVSVVVDIINHKSSEFLEIIIILLIAIEVVMGLLKH